MNTLLRYIQEGVIRIWYWDTGKESKVWVRAATYGNILTQEQMVSIIQNSGMTTDFVRRWGYRVSSNEEVNKFHDVVNQQLRSTVLENTVALSLECTHNKEQ